MEQTKQATRRLTVTLLTDAAILTLACLIPAASHLLAVPLYKLNPMLALLLAGIVVGKDWHNGLLLAVLLPTVSCLVSGMPAMPKMLCMVAEFAAVAAAFGWLERRWAVLPAVLTAVLAGKVVFYLLKAALLPAEALIDIEWWIQAATVVLWGGLFALLYRQRS